MPTNSKWLSLLRCVGIERARAYVNQCNKADDDEEDDEENPAHKNNDYYYSHAALFASFI